MITDNHISSINELVSAVLSDANIEFGGDGDICTMKNMNNKEKFCHLLRSTGREGWKRRACETLYSGRLKTRNNFFNLTHIKSWPMGSKLERLYFLLFRAFIFLILSPKSSI